MLRKAGFRYSKIMQHWEGLARPDEAEALASAHNGTARRVNAANGAAAMPSVAEVEEAAA
jgi:hypothetical protein